MKYLIILFFFLLLPSLGYAQIGTKDVATTASIIKMNTRITSASMAIQNLNQQIQKLQQRLEVYTQKKYRVDRELDALRIIREEFRQDREAFIATKRLLLDEDALTTYGLVSRSPLLDDIITSATTISLYYISP